MKKTFNTIFILAALLSGFAGHSAGQLRNAIWCFGDSAGIDFSNLSNPVPIQSSMDGRGSCVSIADSTGQLLFYAQTLYYPLWWAGYDKLTAVFNKNNLLMQNGDSIIGNGWYRELVIIPYPSSPDFYYLFHTDVTSYSGLYYSVIDMSQNGGLGKVIQKNIQLLNPQMQDGLQAIKHGNGRDWWIFCHRWDIATNEFYKFLVTPSGISGPFIQAIGDTSFGSFLNINFSSSGSQAAIVDYHGLFEILNFDRCTGDFSINPFFTFPISSTSYYNFWSAEFSPSETILYVNMLEVNSHLIQLNLLDSNPLLAIDTLFTIDTIRYSGGALELAPDGKIYYANSFTRNGGFTYPYADSEYYAMNMSLGVINDPNNLGTACNFQPYSFYLGGKRVYYGLPNNPNYELGPDTGSICDTLPHLGVLTNELQFKNKALHVFYHSVWQTAFINAEGLKGRNYSLSIFDITGKQLFSEQGKLDSQYFTKDLRLNFANGIYIVSLCTEKEKLTERFIRD